MKTLMEAFAEEKVPGQPAKRRRVDEYTLRLTKGQWYILEALVNGATLVGPVENLCHLFWGDSSGWHSHATTKSLEKRGLIAKDGILYQLTDAPFSDGRLRNGTMAPKGNGCGWL